MALSRSDLLTGEQLLASKRANAVIRVDEYGLSRFAFDDYLWVAGLRGQEAIGGQLHLTTSRLVFQSHRFNRVAGTFSIFLPTIQAVRDTSHFLTRQLEVRTQTQRYSFVMWGIPEFMAAILATRDRLGPEQQAVVRTVAVAEFAKCGGGLQVQRALEVLNVGILTAQKLKQLVDVATNPLELSSVLDLLELFSD